MHEWLANQRPGAATAFVTDHDFFSVDWKGDLKLTWDHPLMAQWVHAVALYAIQASVCQFGIYQQIAGVCIGDAREAFERSRFEKVFRNQTWAHLKMIFFLLGQAGCISAAARTHLLRLLA